MSRKEVQRLYEACRTDADFRAKVRSGRRAHVEAKKFALTEEEWAVFDAIDWDLTDEQLLEQYAQPLRVT